MSGAKQSPGAMRWQQPHVWGTAENTRHKYETILPLCPNLFDLAQTLPATTRTASAPNDRPGLVLAHTANTGTAPSPPPACITRPLREHALSEAAHTSVMQGRMPSTPYYTHRDTTNR